MSLKKSNLNTDAMISVIRRLYEKEYGTIADIAVEEGYAYPPKRLYIALNDACQCKCMMCANSRKQSGNKDFAETILESLAKELSEYGTYFVFYRQEPLLYENFEKCLDIINKNNIFCQITTNGLLLDQYIDQILDSNVTKIWISIDGIGEVHDSIRGYRGCFSKVINNVEQLIERRDSKSKLQIGISTSCHKYNYLYLTELARYLKGIPIDLVVVNQMRFCTEEMALTDTDCCAVKSMDNNLDILNVEPDEYMMIQKEVKEVLGQKVVFNPEFKRVSDVERYFGDQFTPYEAFKCISSWFSCDINVDGELSFCSIMRRFNPSLSGNCSGNSFMNIWNSEEVRRVRLDILNNTPRVSCGRCSHLLSMPNLVFDSMI